MAATLDDPRIPTYVDIFSMASDCDSNWTLQGKIKLTVPYVHLATPRSRFETIANLPWRLGANNTQSGELDVFVECNCDSNLWSCEAEVEFRLLSQNETAPDISKTVAHEFGGVKGGNRAGLYSFVKWATDIQDRGNDYLKNNAVEVEAIITVKKTSALRVDGRIDFTVPYSLRSGCSSDMVLLIGDVKLHINRAYLSHYSPFFSALFFAEFYESDLKEVPIEDVNPEEFQEMLHVIYPSHKDVTERSVEFLLKLGDKFQVEYLMKECVRFVSNTEKIPVAKKLLWADRYCLAELQEFCIQTFKSYAAVKSLKSTKEYDEISSVTKAALLEKVFKLS